MFEKKNDPDDENEHFKQPHIAVELSVLITYKNCQIKSVS